MKAAPVVWGWSYYIRKKLFRSDSGQALEWLPREVVKSPSLAVFKRCLDEEL